jgi:hydrogenase nickel incorporation protein HypA/HybF
MHELSIAESIVNGVLKEMEIRKISRVIAVGVKIGALSDIVPESLQFGYETIILDTPLKGSELQIEIVPILAHCENCKKSFQVDDFIFVCPECFSSKLDIRQGNELQMAYIEIEDKDK